MILQFKDIISFCLYINFQEPNICILLIKWNNFGSQILVLRWARKNPEWRQISFIYPWVIKVNIRDDSLLLKWEKANMKSNRKRQPVSLLSGWGGFGRLFRYNPSIKVISSSCWVYLLLLVTAHLHLEFREHYFLNIHIHQPLILVFYPLLLHFITWKENTTWIWS